jgi:two-component system, OmpR family, sensor histidine kinase BaeS
LVVRGDRRRLLQVLWNLLANAIRHTPEGGSVEVSAEPQGGGIAILVTDTGEGIAEADLERIFEEYFRVPNQADEGTGLGLPISRRLLELMEGTIEVSSVPGAGSIFTAWLPAAVPADHPLA